MHIADLSKGMLGANAIVGGAPPLAIGAALTAKTLKTGNVGVSFTGDGGSNQGLVFEAINMAVVLQLPAVFIFENNGYGDDYAVGGRDIARRAAGFGLPAVTVDGTDFFAVYEATSEAVKRAREGGGPSVIEAKAFRWHGHFEGDPALYRAEGEVQRLREQHDPLKIFTAKVKRQITQEELTAIDEEVEALVNDAVLKACAAAYPAPEDLLTDVYVSY